MKRESQLLFRVHPLFVVFGVFHDYRDSGVTANDQKTTECSALAFD
jgi:hypothetical protein